jgi:hypothetical protein
VKFNKQAKGNENKCFNFKCVMAKGSNCTKLELSNTSYKFWWKIIATTF